VRDHMVTWELASAGMRSHHDHGACGDMGVCLDWDAEPPWVQDHVATPEPTSGGATMNAGGMRRHGSHLTWEAEPPQAWSQVVSWEPAMARMRSHHGHGVTWNHGSPP
jgi:hypothetical protein